jgi:LmbE family N-acetylglucosaminyl deacetylase
MKTATLGEAERLERYVKSIHHEAARAKMMTEADRILAVSPHPDDSEIIAGGYLASCVDRGAKVRVLVVSDDRMSFTSMDKPLSVEAIVTARKAEELKALRLLGIKNIGFLEHIDSRVPEPKELMPEMIHAIRSFEADIVLTVDPYLPYESHPDHINTGLATLRAAMLGPYPYIERKAKISSPPPSVALGATASPNAVIGIENTIDRKIASVLAHESQFPDKVGMEKSLRTMASALGKLIGKGYGEAFSVLRNEELHMDVLASF